MKNMKSKKSKIAEYAKKNRIVEKALHERFGTKRHLVNSMANLIGTYFVEYSNKDVKPIHGAIIAGVLLGRSQEEIGKQVGLSGATVGQIERQISFALHRGLADLGQKQDKMRQFFIKKMAEREQGMMIGIRAERRELTQAKKDSENFRSGTNSIENALDVMKSDPSTYTDKYLCGMANGLILAKSYLGFGEPNFIDTKVTTAFGFDGPVWTLDKIMSNKPWWIPTGLYYRIIKPFVSGQKVMVKKTIDDHRIEHVNCKCHILDDKINDPNVEIL